MLDQKITGFILINIIAVHFLNLLSCNQMLIFLLGRISMKVPEDGFMKKPKHVARWGSK